MKYIFTAIILIFSSFTYAQLPKDENGKVVFSDVIDAPGLSKEELHSKSKSWILSTFKSTDNMVGFDSEGNDYDEIIATNNLFIQEMEYDYHQQYGKRYQTKIKDISVNFKLIINFKDEKLRYSFENFICAYSKGQGSIYVESITTGLESVECPTSIRRKRKGIFKKEFEIKFQELIKENIDSLIKDYKNTVISKRDDDW